MEKDNFQKALDKLRPSIEKLVREVDNDPAAVISGFVLNAHSHGLIQFGNLDTIKGDSLIGLHIYLSTLAAEMAEKNPMLADLDFADVDAGRDPVGQAPEEIADALARLVLVTGLEDAYAAQVQELAQRYIQARRIPENGK